jgi:hypothetical protein
MPETAAPAIYRESYQSFADALDVTPRTVMRWCAEGKVRAVKLAPKVVRLEPPAEFVAREGQSLITE